jgi:DNA-binding transcriptional regulator YiaG
MTVNPSKKKTLRAKQRRKKYHNVYAEIAAVVRRAREKKKMTQKEFAAFLGVSEISVRRWELALGHEPHFKIRQKIKEILDGDPINSSAAL